MQFSYYTKNLNISVHGGIRTRALWVTAKHAAPMTTEADAEGKT